MDTTETKDKPSVSELMEKLKNRGNRQPLLLKGEWTKEEKYVKDKHGQKFILTIDDDTTEITNDGIIKYMAGTAEVQEELITPEQITANLMVEADLTEDDLLCWSFPYWNHNRPEEGQFIIQKRVTKGGLAYDGLIMINYVIYKINLWEQKDTDAMNIDGREEASERARIAKL